MLKDVFMVLVSSRWSCLLKDPRIASVLRAMKSFKSFMYLPIVEAALRSSWRVGWGSKDLSRKFGETFFEDFENFGAQ